MRYMKSVDIYRLVLAFFVCVISDGYVFGNYQPIAGFATIAFFILTGYLVCRETSKFEERVGRAIKRTAILFGCMLAAYLILNIIYFAVIDIVYRDQMPASMFTNFRGFGSLRIWFEFLVLNVWPSQILPFFGSSIWFLQALLYAYIIMYVLHKLKLPQKKWFDPVVCGVLVLFMLASGEFSMLTNLHILKYAYIPGNFLTRALPYILVGRMLFRWENKLPRHRTWIYLLIAAAGLGMSVVEIVVLDKIGKLVYLGHLLGNGVLATAVTAYILTLPTRTGDKKPLFNGGLVAKVVYLSHEVVSFLVLQFTALVAPDALEGVQTAVPVIIYVLCVAGVAIYALVVTIKKKGWHQFKHDLMKKLDF